MSPKSKLKKKPIARKPARSADKMAWWRKARFGLFVHWGLYSVPAGFHKGNRVEGYGEWIMQLAKMPVAEYKQYAAQFNPTKFDADEWVQTAKDAGMKYIVITAKHHDGFAMFDSKTSDWNIAAATPFKRDPLAELAEACRRHKIKLGFYYSQAQDWCHKGGAAWGDVHWDDAQKGSMDDYLRDIAVPQVRELLTRYGDIPVLWWDTPCGMDNKRAEQFLPLLKLHPNVITNDRLGGTYRGDTESPEQYIPATGFDGRDWETCMTLNRTWGFRSDDHWWKSVPELIRMLVDVASKGGNFLLNVGPTAEGVIPEDSVLRLREVGRWLEKNGDAIYGTTANPFTNRLPWGRSTKKLTATGGTLYLHVFDWPANRVICLPGLKTKIKKAYLLTDPKRKPLRTVMTDCGVAVHLPAKATDRVCTVIAAELAGKLVVVPLLPEQAADGTITLKASDVNTHGHRVCYESGGDSVGWWIHNDDWIDWSFRVAKPGRFRVVARLSAMSPNAFTLSLGEQKLDGKSVATGNWTEYAAIDLGTLDIAAAGISKIEIHPVKESWAPMNVKSITLEPVK